MAGSHKWSDPRYCLILELRWSKILPDLTNYLIPDIVRSQNWPDLIPDIAGSQQWSDPIYCQVLESTCSQILLEWSGHFWDPAIFGIGHFLDTSNNWQYLGSVHVWNSAISRISSCLGFGNISDQAISGIRQYLEKDCFWDPAISGTRSFLGPKYFRIPELTWSQILSDPRNGLIPKLALSQCQMFAC